MKVRYSIRVAVVTLMSLSSTLPVSAWSGPPVPSTDRHVDLQATDVRLSEQGQFLGTLIDQDGRPIAGAEVQLWSSGKVVQDTTSDANGRVSLTPSRPGLYQIVSGETAGVVRIWNAEGAPPAAKSNVLLVQGPVVRGQHQPGIGAGVYDGSVVRLLSNPWVFSGLVGAAIAVPIIISNNDDDNEGS